MSTEMISLDGVTLRVSGPEALLDGRDPGIWEHLQITASPRQLTTTKAADTNIEDAGIEGRESREVRLFGREILKSLYTFPRGYRGELPGIARSRHRMLAIVAVCGGAGCLTRLFGLV